MAAGGKFPIIHSTPTLSSIITFTSWAFGQIMVYSKLERSGIFCLKRFFGQTNFRGRGKMLQH